MRDGHGGGTGAARIRVWALSQPVSRKGSEAVTSIASASACPGRAAPGCPAAGRRPDAEVDQRQPGRFAERQVEQALELLGGHYLATRCGGVGQGAFGGDPETKARRAGGFRHLRPLLRLGELEHPRHRGDTLEQAETVDLAHGVGPFAEREDKADSERREKRDEEERDELGAERAREEPHAAASSWTSAASV